jgi:ribosomal protein S18 acetylase RimI-like enzyme
VASIASEPASTLSVAERAALFTAAYEGYLLPFVIDEPTLAFMEHAFDLVPEASLVARLDGEAIGLANLGLRGDDAWVGGIGIVPAHRGSGHGEALMRALLDEARARGARRVWLEVIVENTAAAALYEKLGFVDTRELEVWSLPGAEGDGAETVPLAAAAALLGDACEPWQRSDETIARLAELDPAPVGVVAAEGAAIVRASGGRVTILRLGGDEAALRTVLAATRTLGESVLLLNLPAGDPAAPVLRELGATVAVRQRELVLEL